MNERINKKVLENIAELNEKFEQPLIALHLRHYYNLGDDEIYDSFTDGMCDQGIDAIYIDKANKEIILFQEKNKKQIARFDNFSSNSEYKAFQASVQNFKIEVDTDETTNYFKTSNEMLQSKINYIKELNDEQFERTDDAYKISYTFIINSDINDKCNLNVIDISDIKSYIAIEKKNTSYPDIEVEIEQSMSYTTDEGLLIYFAFVKISEIRNLISQKISYERLLYDNVRYNLPQSEINSKIKTSLETEDIQFMNHYNNGITFVCDKASVKGRVIKMKNASIVNGGQTFYQIITSTLYSEEATIAIKILVQEKLKKEITDKIPLYLNSQNSIKSELLYCNNEVLNLLAENIGKNSKFWIEMKQNMEPPEKKLKKNVVKIDELLQLIVLFYGTNSYHLIRNGKSQLFANEELIYKAIRKIKNYNELINIIKLDRQVNKTLTQHRSVKKKGTNDPALKTDYSFVSTSRFLIEYGFKSLNDDYTNMKFSISTFGNICDTIQEILCSQERYNIRNIDNAETFTSLNRKLSEN